VVFIAIRSAGTPVIRNRATPHRRQVYAVCDCYGRFLSPGPCFLGRGAGRFPRFCLSQSSRFRQSPVMGPDGYPRPPECARYVPSPPAGAAIPAPPQDASRSAPREPDERRTILLGILSRHIGKCLSSTLSIVIPARARARPGLTIESFVRFGTTPCSTPPFYAARCRSSAPRPSICSTSSPRRSRSRSNRRSPAPRQPRGRI
jgi:hypothetical protein